MLRRRVLIPVLMFVAGAILGVTSIITVQERIQDEDAAGIALRRALAAHGFTQSLLGCSTTPKVPASSLDGLRRTLAAIVGSAKATGTVDEASVYYRRLDSGEWTDIEGDHAYTPASLMKLPVLMAYLKDAEANPGLLSEAVTVTADPVAGATQQIPAKVTALAGQTYSVERLLELMTMYSDNRALDVLMQHASADTLGRILWDLGIPIPAQAQQYTITPRLYARLFRILYAATYLDPVMSTKALTLLSSADFDAAIVAGVDKGVRVAHKFGEAIVTRPDGTPGRALHDCGIVYAKAPYVLCIMTQGRDVGDLERLSVQVSRASFDATRADL
jgi:beta-lactamase class A